MKGIALLALLALAGCKSSSTSTSTTSAPSPGVASTAEIRWKDAGPADFAVLDRVMALPTGELPDQAHPAVTQDEQGKRFALPLPSGETRYVYLVASSLYLGARTKSAADFGPATDLDHALGPLFENAGARRSKLVADVAKALGDAGVARLLIAGGAVDGRDWDDAYAKLPEASQAQVKTGLAATLEKGKPSVGLRHAVALLPLREPARAPALAARIRELADGLHEPRGSAVMLRALITLDKAQAGAVGCDVLERTPLEPNLARGNPEEVDAPGRELLAEAALLAIATAGSDCKHVAPLLGDEMCQPSFRCGPGGPLDGRETSKQDEPLCTKEQLATAAAKDLDRQPADVLGLTAAARPHLYAFAALLASNKVPETFLAAHARRRYELTQPAAPSCEGAGDPGTPCHCDEAVVRDQACRHPGSKVVSVGTCKFAVDEKQKKLLDVVVTTPP